MSNIKNSAGFFNIFEICKTDTYVGSDFSLSTPGGFKFKCTATGNVQVHYIGDPAGTNRTIIITTEMLNQWLPDRVDNIISAGTTLSSGEIIIGY